jgi:chitinase
LTASPSSSATRTDPGPACRCGKSEAGPLLGWAKTKTQKISTLSFWALLRDNGGCPGTKGAGTCSGIKQPTWYFSHQFEPFSG